MTEQDQFIRRTSGLEGLSVEHHVTFALKSWIALRAVLTTLDGFGVSLKYVLLRGNEPEGFEATLRIGEEDTESVQKILEVLRSQDDVSSARVEHLIARAP